jgi:hypothetical protein
MRGRTMRKSNEEAAVSLSGLVRSGKVREMREALRRVSGNFPSKNGMS